MTLAEEWDEVHNLQFRDKALAWWLKALRSATMRTLPRKEESLLEIIVGIVGLVIGVPGFILAWPSIKGYAKSLRARHVIVLFGPPAAGKTSFVKYLKGEPIPRQHIQTHNYNRSGKIIYDLSGSKSYFFTLKEVVDMGGEFDPQLKPILSKYNPQAVILIFDTSDEKKEKKSLEDVADAYQRVLSEHVVEDVRLKVILILLNKCEAWGNSTAEHISMKKSYEDTILADTIERLRSLVPNLEVDIQPVSFMHSSYKNHTDETLRWLAQLLEARSR